MTTWLDTLRVLFETHLGLKPHVTNSLLGTGVVILGYWLVRILVGRLLERRIEDVSRRYAATKTLQYTLGFVAFLVLLRVWVAGTGMGAMGAYLGILSAGLAIALQDPLTNLAGWLFLVVRKPFVVGDRVEIGEHAGDVIDIRLFAFSVVEIRNWVRADQSTGRIIHIPNGWLFQKAVTNFTQAFSFVWHEIPVVVTFESDWRLAKEILTEIATRHASIQSEAAAEEVRRAARKYLIFYHQLTPIVWTRVVDHGVELTIRYPTEARGRRGSEQAIWEDVLDAFSPRDDMDFAYPTQRFFDHRTEGKGADGA